MPAADQRQVAERSALQMMQAFSIANSDTVEVCTPSATTV